ncbi:hypothetical protein GDO81_012368 [Engystomops pustulosus]|uniref:Uncharacterized protein n=1 Tax=Engystomops pustulosus TaxID=76066 RepID=A0AAV7BLU6_ENGPU|nr:hypothetical protein GDO81_012368 [Engystomops pustulosus]
MRMMMGVACLMWVTVEEQDEEKHRYDVYIAAAQTRGGRDSLWSTLGTSLLDVDL